MKKVIGAEISPRAQPLPREDTPVKEPEEAVESQSRPSQHVLDLRPQPPHQAPEEANEEPDDEGPVEVPSGTIVIHDRVAEDVARLGTHQEPEDLDESEARGGAGGQGELPEQAGAGHVSAPAEDKGSVRPREGSSPGAPRKSRQPFSWRRLLGRLAKLTITLVGAVFFLMLTIPLPERLIGIYLVASLVYAFDSQRTFIVALIFLAMVAGSSAIGQSVPAENYAVYAFYFLVIGLVAAIREQIGNRPKTVGGNSQLSDG